MKQILSTLIMLLLTPLSSYSYSSTQDDTLVINRKQVVSILKDKRELEYRRELNKQDSLHISELNSQILNHKRINTNNELRITNFEQLINKERTKSKVYKTLFYVTAIVVPTVYIYSRVTK